MTNTQATWIFIVNLRAHNCFRHPTWKFLIRPYPRLQGTILAIPRDEEMRASTFWTWTWMDADLEHASTLCISSIRFIWVFDWLLVTGCWLLVTGHLEDCLCVLMGASPQTPIARCARNVEDIEGFPFPILSFPLVCPYGSSPRRASGASLNQSDSNLQKPSFCFFSSLVLGAFMKHALIVALGGPILILGAQLTFRNINSYFPTCLVSTLPN